MLFPNVQAANVAKEVQELENRFAKALADAKARGCDSELNAFVTACKGTKAVFNCSLEKLTRAVATGTDTFETYYDLERLRIRSENTGDVDWQRVRPQAEIELLGSERYIDQLFYSLLSIDGDGLASYGECSCVLKDSMISHRSSCFEENTGVFWEKTRRPFPPGKRSDWSSRHKLCAAKLACRVTSTTRPADFSRMLKNEGKTRLDDDFVEVQVFGPPTARTLETVAIAAKNIKGKKTYWNALRKKLADSGVATSER